MDSGGFGAVAFAVLLTVSMFAPAVSAAQTNDSDAISNTASSGTAYQVEQQPLVNTSNDPAIVLKIRAIEQIQSLNDSDSINATVFSTLYAYRGPNRVNSSRVFTNDSEALRELRAYTNESSAGEARNASVLLAAADNATAYQSIRDAERTLSFARERIDHRGTLRSSETHLDNAHRAYERGLAELQRAEEADPDRAIHHRAQAVIHFRQAWSQSHKVFDRLDRELSPDVTISNRADPVRNGSANRSVTANIRAVDPESIETVTVLVDGQPRETTNVSTVGVGPVENATATATVALPDRTANVTVVVDPGSDSTDDQSDTAGKGNGGSPKKSGKGKQESGTNSSATLLLDGDGFTDTYEQETLGTDPLDPDSDAAVTDADESDNGVVDGNEDFDGDGLSTLRELKLGTDPLAADTDGDGLDDRFELQLTQTDPTDPDSDGDGVNDGDEDLDNDGLTNAEEAEAGTLPLIADIDRDGLSDSQELANGTSPFESDTDDDDLDDAVERQSPYNTDPTDPDTDDDGVLDGNETYTSSTENESLGVSVEVTGQGDAVATTTIEKPTHARFHEESPLARNVSVAEGPFADFESEGEIENATLTFEYDESQISTNESALAVYRFNETLQRYEKLPSTVDSDSNTVRAETSHFSTYTVLDEDAYQAFLERLREAVVSGDSSVIYQENFDGMSLNDSEWTCRNDPYGGPHGSTPAEGYCEVEDGWATVQEETNRMRYLNRTVTLDVPEDSDVLVTTHVRAQVNAQWSDAAMKLVVTNSSASRTVAELDNGWSGQTRTINTVTTADVSDFAGETVNISLQADGRWTYQHQNTTSWISVNNITITGGQLADEDGDGIPDLQEKHLPLRNYGVVSTSTDPTPEYTNPRGSDGPAKGFDTDGDGLPDGVEVINTSKVIAPDATEQKVFSLNQEALEEGDYDWRDPSTYINESALVETSDGFYGYPWLADPTEAHTDTDGLNDAEEVNGWGVSVDTKTVDGRTVPYRWVNDSADTEIRFSSDPREVHSDDDGLNDYEEKQINTDPRDKRTYHLTTEHEEIIESINTETDRGQQVLSSLQPTVSVEQPALTDGTDDFDLVIANSDPDDAQWFYTPLGADRETTDRWLSNEQEITTGGPPTHSPPRYKEYETDPWDPDTDDDGLTDGQEIYGIDVEGDTYRTDPTKVDTDGDLRWDGWIGVYGVGYSDNVILYKEHLQSGDGIEGDEIVQEQVGVHHTSEVTSLEGADIDDDGKDEHSNIHIGELQWGTDPTDQTDAHNGIVTVEADFLEGLPMQSLNTPEWERGIEENFALYGIHLYIQRDDRIEAPDGWFDIPGQVKGSYDMHKINDEPTDLSLFANNEPPGIFPKSDATGVSFDGIMRTHVDAPDWASKLESIYGSNSHMLFTGNIDGSPGERMASYDDFKRTPYRNSEQLVSAAVEMHELGHSFHIGEVDDDGPLPLQEVYSGSGTDDTPERIIDRNKREIRRWSLMREGWRPQSLVYHNSAAYHVFSLEELSTIQLP